jgi:ribosomal protein L37AE/L43A
MYDHDHPIDRFDPLLRNMLAWDLVVENEDGSWTLRPEVVERLRRLASYTKPHEPSEVVYFGHNCAKCRSTGLTRFRDGVYLCDECRRAAEVEAVATLVPVPESDKPRRFSRSRKIAS